MGYFLAIITAVVTIAGNITAKIWATKNQPAMLVYTMIFYIASSIAFPLALKYGKLTTLNAFATVFIFAFTAIAGLVYFKENINRFEVVGLLLSFAAILLFVVGAKAS